MKRKAELVLVVGINGSGKTTFIKNEIVAKSKKTLIVTPDFQEWKHLRLISTPAEIYNLKGCARIIYEGTETLEMIKGNFYGGNLLLDDAMSYLDQQTPKMMNYLYIRRRQFGIDLFIVAHGLRQLPPKCFTFASWLILFDTVENFEVRKKELLPDLFNRIVTAQRNIKKKVVTGNPYHKEIILLDTQIKGLHEARRKTRQ